MGVFSKQQWEHIEKYRGVAFLLGGTIFAVDVALVASHAISGTEPGAFGQALVGAAWTASFVGLLGMYPKLSAERRWLARVGAVFAVVGGVTMAVMALSSLGYATGVLAGSLSDVVMFFLPGIFLGIVVGFGLLGVASLRTGTYPRSVGLLCLVLVGTFLFNLTSGVAGFGTLWTVLGVVVVLAATKLALGYQFRTGRTQATT